MPLLDGRALGELGDARDAGIDRVIADRFCARSTGACGGRNVFEPFPGGGLEAQSVGSSRVHNGYVSSARAGTPVH